MQYYNAKHTKKEIFRGAEWLNTNHPNNLMALAVVKHPRDYCKILQLIRNFMYPMVVQEIEIFWDQDSDACGLRASGTFVWVCYWHMEDETLLDHSSALNNPFLETFCYITPNNHLGMTKIMPEFITPGAQKETCPSILVIRRVILAACHGKGQN